MSTLELLKQNAADRVASTTDVYFSGFRRLVSLRSRCQCALSSWLATSLSPHVVEG